MKHDTTEICSKQPRSKAYHLSALRDQSLGKFMHGREDSDDLEVDKSLTPVHKLTKRLVT
jgi:hypothetical protein